MVIKAKYKNPLFISVFLSVLVIYSNWQKIPLKDPFMSIVGEDEVSFVSGILVSSPSRTSGGRYYSVKVKAWQCGNTKGLVSGAKGIFNAYIPASSVEAFFPGRLYSVSEAEMFLKQEAVFFLKEVFRRAHSSVRTPLPMVLTKAFFHFSEKYVPLEGLNSKGSFTNGEMPEVFFWLFCLEPENIQNWKYLRISKGQVFPMFWPCQECIFLCFQALHFLWETL